MPPDPPFGDDFAEVFLKLTDPDPPAPERTVTVSYTHLTLPTKA